MEGFLEIKIKIWVRTLLTRGLALVPALLIIQAMEDRFTDISLYLNILQSIQLPFALIPLLKFVGSPSLMGDFTLGKCW